MTKTELKKRIAELYTELSNIYDEILEESNRGYKTNWAYLGILEHNLAVGESILEGYQEQLAALSA